MATEHHTDKIATADADPTQSTGWRWPAAYLATVVLIVPVMGIRSVLPETLGDGLLFVFLLGMFVAFWGGFYFGLKDFYTVKKSSVEWNPSFWRYFLLNFFLTPITSFSVYVIQRYRHTGLRTELDP